MDRLSWTALLLDTANSTLSAVFSQKTRPASLPPDTPEESGTSLRSTLKTIQRSQNRFRQLRCAKLFFPPGLSMMG